MNFIETLTDEELQDLSEAAELSFILSLRMNPTIEVKEVATRIDKIIAKAPSTTVPITVYKAFNGPGVELLHDGGELTENAFLTVSKTKPKITGDSVRMDITIPKGTHIIDSNEWSILPRGIELQMRPIKNGSIQASVIKIDPIKL